MLDMTDCGPTRKKTLGLITQRTVALGENITSRIR